MIECYCIEPRGADTPGPPPLTLVLVLNQSRRYTNKKSTSKAAGEGVRPTAQRVNRLHASTPSNFSPSGVSSGGRAVFLFPFTRVARESKPLRRFHLSPGRMRISRRSSRDSSAGVIEMYWAMRTLSFDVLGRMPWASRLLKISRSPAFGITGTISKPVVSGFQGSRLAG